MHAPNLGLSRSLARAVPFGIIWGVATGAMEALSLPVVDRSWSSFGVLILSNVSAWSVVGIGIAWLVERAQWRLERPLFLAVASILATLAFSAVASWIFSIRWLPGPGFGIARVIPDQNPVASFAYQAWIVMFYGGLYAIAWRFNQRAERTRALLDQTQIARMRSETLFGDAQLRALRGHVDPAFLLHVMREVEHRYAAAHGRADHLTNLLVGFLRLAMPGVRSGSSTLATELALARSYAELWSDLDHERATWRIEALEPWPDMPFPPLLLLPILDRLAVASGAEARGRVQVASNSACVTLTFDANGVAGSDWLTPELAYRIRVGLSTRLGDAWSMSFRDPLKSDAPALRITMRADRTPEDEQSLDASLSTASISKGSIHDS